MNILKTLRSKLALLIIMTILIIIFTIPENKKDLSVASYPKSLSGYCQEFKSFEVEFENNLEVHKIIKLKLENQKSIKLFYPERFILPPGKKTNMTIITQFDCTTTHETTISFIIDQERFKIDFQIKRW